MLAKDEKILESTGEYEISQEEFQFNEVVNNSYPRILKFSKGNQMNITLKVQEIIDGDNLLFELSPILRFAVKYLLRLKPGYFRLKSKFNIEIKLDGESYKEQGTTLHEMVVAK